MSEYNPILGTVEWQERVRNAPHLLFEAVKTIVEMSGGDGWGLIISSKYKELADLFEKGDNHFTERKEDKNIVTFSAWPEESISFTKYRPEHTDWYEIIVEYRWPMLEDFSDE